MKKNKNLKLFNFFSKENWKQQKYLPIKIEINDLLLKRKLEITKISINKN